MKIHKKNLIKNVDKDKKQQTNNTDTKPPSVFNYLKSLSPKAKDLMDEIEDNDDDIDIKNLLSLVVADKNLTLTLLICH